MPDIVADNSAEHGADEPGAREHGAGEPDGAQPGAAGHDAAEHVSGGAPVRSVRRHDLDWLRVILFGLLIPFHVATGLVWGIYGEVFIPDTAVAGDAPLAVEGIFLTWMHQWRLAGLFMISGMGTAFAFQRRTIGKFLLERTTRLVIPLVFGMFVVNLVFWWIVAYENLPNDTADSQAFFESSPLLWFIVAIPYLWGTILTTINTLHLWFLFTLFLYSLMGSGLFAWISSYPDGGVVRFFRRVVGWRGGLGLLLILPIPLVITEFAIKPFKYGTIAEGYEFPWYLIFFLLGYILIIAKDEYLVAIRKMRISATVLAAISTVALVAFIVSTGEDTDWLLNGGWYDQGFVHDGRTIISCILHPLHAWFWCVTIFAWGAHLLNRPSRILTYLNQAVYPFYIVHMSFMFLALYLLRGAGLTLYPMFAVVTLFVVLGCWATFEVVKRTRVTRALFGIKPLPIPSPLPSSEPNSPRAANPSGSAD